MKLLLELTHSFLEYIFKIQKLVPRRNLYSYHKYKNSHLSSQRRVRYASFSKRRVRHYSEAVFPRYQSRSRTVFRFNWINTIFKKMLIWIILPSFIILITGGFIIKSSYLKITKFSYEGLNSVNQEELEEYLKKELPVLNQSSLLPSDNYFLVDTKKLEDSLNKKFPTNYSVVTKNFPNTLNVQMNEKDSSVVYYNGEKYYLLDQNGFLIKPLTIIINQAQTEQTTINSSTISTSTSLKSANIITGEKLGKEFEKLPIIYDKRNLEIKNGTISAELIKTILEWKELLEKQKIASIKYFAFENPESGIEIFTNQVWKIYFNAQINPADQFNNLKLVLKENKPQEYIDVRYEGRVFWK